MMNDMMKMDGTMNDMGMDMSLQQMDMNTVMYPEITGEKKKNPNIRISNRTMPSNDIVTLNYAMLKSPTKPLCQRCPYQN